MRDENNNVQAHRRYVSADITGHGMLLHSRENSTNSPVVIYLPDNHDEIDARPRPRSTSAWSNFSLGEEYGFGDASSIDTGRNARHRYDDADEDNDAIHLTPLSPAKTGFHHTQPHTLDVDLEGTPPGLYSSSIVPSKGISRRAQGTEKYYRQSQSGTAATSGVTRRRTILENVQSTVRKMSVRVVNLAQEDSQGHVPLTDDMEDLDEQHPKGKSDTEEAKHEDVRAHLSRSTTGSSNGSLRGKSLGVFDPDNPARKAALAFFLWGCVLSLICY